MTIHCDGALSDAVLQAARNAIPSDWHKLITLPPSSKRNQPLLALLACLIDATQATAKAIEDNAFDDNGGIDHQLAREFSIQLSWIQIAIANAAEPPSL